MSTEDKKLEEIDIIKIEMLATKLADIAHVLEIDVLARTSAMAISLGITAASLGFKKEEIVELVASYFDKTDKFLAQLEEGLKLAPKTDQPRVIKPGTLN